MYNIGIVSENNQLGDTYSKELNKLTYQIYQLSSDDIINEASKMDALIIEETPTCELKNICELILELRRDFDALIWIVSKNLTKTSRIIYLQLGADGVVDKESDEEESILQLSNILNRVNKKPNVQTKEARSGKKVQVTSNLELIPNNLSVLVEGKEVSLTRLEFQTISFLFDNLGTAVKYEEIYTNVWKEEFEDIETGNKQYRVSNLIFHLRKKLEENPTQPKYIKTVRSKGYMIVR
ncbi:winged helix-turn-helix domain-containing protein [Enterococcus crotali]|uniref:winged helix-turn-helix domain-containing protein n=1 Tax=Enterococcus crotali TaxID=1453587 RepID=UPI00047093B2|nr:winged helix-turn-helix domain-containing protein [Enterococcus crotali]